MKLEVIAHSAIRIENKDGQVIYLDPFMLNDNYKNDANFIFITHSHYDHFSPEDIYKIKNEKTKIILTEDLLEKAIDCGFNIENIIQVIPNNEYEEENIKFQTIPAYNINKQFHKKEFGWIGYILNIDEKKVYVAGDTDITKEALNVKCDIALVPVGGTYTMTAEEAAELIEKIKPKEKAIPTHYKTIVGSVNDAIRFKELLNGKIEVNILIK